MIKYITGDILDSDETVVAHGVNCRGGFGSGFAGQIAQRYVNTKTKYFEKYANEGWMLGDIQETKDRWDGRIIVNCATQTNYGTVYDGPYVSYEAIRRVVQRLIVLYPKGFAMPKIGCGLAGGNWDIVSKIIEQESGSIEIRVYELDK